MFLPKKSLPEIARTLLQDRDAEEVSAQEILDSMEAQSMRPAQEIDRLRMIYRGLSVARLIERELSR